MAINLPLLAFARLKFKNLFVGNCKSLSRCMRIPSVGTLPHDGAARGETGENRVFAGCLMCFVLDY